MTDRRPRIIAGLVAAAVLVIAAFLVGRSSAPDSAGTSPPAGPTALTQSIGGVTIGVVNSKAGALAAADNYVVQAAESFIQAPDRYEQLVRRAYAPSYQRQALDEGRRTRATSNVTPFYASGGKTISIVPARRIEAYSSSAARVVSWAGALSWGPGSSEQDRPNQTWSLTTTNLRWDGQRWLVAGIESTSRDAPAPVNIGYEGAAARTAENFDQQLRGMSAPSYGG